jgi:Zn-dependent metalloprotease
MRKTPRSAGAAGAVLRTGLATTMFLLLGPPAGAVPEGTGPVPSAPTSASSLQVLVAAALRALPEQAAALGFPADGLGVQRLGADYSVAVTDVIVEPNGAGHVRLERTFRGLPVLGGDFVVHRTPTGRWAGSDATLRTPIRLGTVPRLSAAAAAGPAVPSGDIAAGAPRLVVDAYGSVPRLAWDVRSLGVRADGTPSDVHTYVDAMSGSVLERDDRVHTLLAPADAGLAGPNGAAASAAPAGGDAGGANPTIARGTGRSLYAGTVRLDTTLAAGVYQLKDLTRGGGYVGDADDRSDQCLPLAIPLCTSTAPAVPFTNKDNMWGDGGRLDRATVAVDAQYGSNRTWDFYKHLFNRVGVANDGLGVYSRVHYGIEYANAFWNDDCLCMTYGDGDGTELGPLVSLDITGHEISHGMTSHTAKLTNFGESGGLNEASSDIYGAAIEFSANNAKDVGDYLIGETSFLHKRDKQGDLNAIRYMDRPSRDHSSPDCWNATVKGLDVHLQAGIGNHAFYLLSEGSGRKTINRVGYDSPTCNGAQVTGIGRLDAVKIWYRAETLHMTSATDFAGARVATTQAAKELFGAKSTQYQAVQAAWDAVNVFPGGA